MATPLSPAVAAARYRALFEATADPILVADADGRHVDANPAALSLLRYTLQELLQLHVSDVSAQAAASVRAEFERLIRDGEWRGESAFRRKDGSIFPVEIRASQAVLRKGTLYVTAFRDLTERKRAEAQLRESEARLRALLDQLPVGVGLTDAEGRWVLTNGLMTPFVGEVTASRDPRRMVRWQVWDAHGRALDPTEWPAARAFRGETVAGVDALFTPERGAAQWRRLSAAPFYSADGQIVGVIAVNQDIDAHKRAEAALRESEARYRALVHATATNVWRMSADGTRLLEIQGSLVTPHDFTPELASEWLSRYIHPEDQEAMLAAWRQAVETTSVYDHEQRARYRDGNYRWVHGHAVPVRDEHGEVQEWIGTSTDITERLAAEATTARLASIIGSSRDAILSESLDGIILDWNPGAEALYGYTAAEAVGRHVSFVIPPEQDHEPAEVFPRLGRGELVPPFETIRLRKDGTRVDVEVRLSPLHDAEGRVIGVSAIARDITERKHLEQLRQDVLAMASHDLRNPLAVINMRTQLLQSRQAYDEDGVEIIREQARLMTRLVDDLGDMVRLETGQVELRQENLDLRMLVSEAVDRIQAQTERHVIHVEIPVGPVTGSWDRDRLAEALDNLLADAVKSSPEGGEIVMRVETTAGEARLSVANHTVGIPTEALPEISELFHRADGTRLPGPGLGLYIARMLVEAHRGRIQVESAPGQGSIFTLYLPLMPAAKFAGLPA